MKNKMSQLFVDQRNTHVLYAYHDMEHYIDQIVSFTQEGVLAGDYVILIENERVYNQIHKELITRLSKDQMEYVHFVNNFDFYFSSGSYHPPAIQDYFNKIVQPYVEDKIAFRSWAHVEWATIEEPLHIIEDFEKIVDDAVNQYSFPLICAYEAEQMPEYLKKILLETHPYILVENECIVSEQYQT
ncbi:MEDS domain-containing protein [Pseudalkalibacillus berkeleyi]|uniref:MEDS domain-containing protein n=1 Tax=Pseudalkalibacillus berkeleyi TaxID=1069813 RepID=A0ABS9GXV4_9BACL|nr:MEDS domain-containing protein [Pseudalkalibacillus berkeleyi]MCF6136651.1 MEDS domain-containing protein [Pseudalkalibacillus berkeleyi]